MLFFIDKHLSMFFLLLFDIFFMFSRFHSSNEFWKMIIVELVVDFENMGNRWKNVLLFYNVILTCIGGQLCRCSFLIANSYHGTAGLVRSVVCEPILQFIIGSQNIK